MRRPSATWPAASTWWNSGMFFFRAQDMLRAVEQHLPAVHQQLQLIERAAAQGPEAEREATRVALRRHALDQHRSRHQEKLESLAVVPGSFGWSDLGSWHRCGSSANATTPTTWARTTRYSSTRSAT